MAGRTRRLLLVPIALVLFLVAAAPASADVATQSGKCSMGWSTYRVEFKNDIGPRLEISAFVNATQANRPWHVHVRHNGTLFFSQTFRANGAGNVYVEMHHPAKPLLSDTLVIKAFNKGTGEVCKASATLK